MLNFIKKCFSPIPITHSYESSSIESKSILTRSSHTDLKLELTKNSSPFQFGFLSTNTTQIHSIFTLNNIFLQTSIDHEKNIQFLVQNQIKNITTKFQSIKNASEIYTQLEVHCSNKYNNVTYRNVNNYNVPIHVFSFMQSLNKNLSFGMEILNFKRNLSCSFVTRMTGDSGVVTLGMQNNGLNVNIYKKLNEFFSMASETIYDGKTVNHFMGVNLLTKKANVSVEVGSDAKMRINLKNKLFEGCSFKISSEMDVFTGRQTFGLGLSIEK